MIDRKITEKKPLHGQRMEAGKCEFETHGVSNSKTNRACETADTICFMGRIRFWTLGKYQYLNLTKGLICIKKVICFVPFVLLTITYTVMALVGFTAFTADKVVLLLALLVSGFLLAKRKSWGSLFGLISAAVFVYMSTRYTGSMIKMELLLGLALAVFYIIYGITLFRKKDR